MQLIGLGIFVLVVSFGFSDREMAKVSAFDLHAMVIVLCGSAAAIITSSSAITSLRTLLALRELVPFAGTLHRSTERLEDERKRFAELWREGRRAQAVELAEASPFPPMRHMLKLVLARASEKATDTVFLELRHAALSRWQPATSNWELLAKLGPSFGMVGTVTGMIQLFKNMGDDNLNIGAAMSLALVATLYGIGFGAGVAGPIGHYLRSLLDERLGVLSRCRQSVIELAESAGEVRVRG
jgi:chemotaxis protein MotA